MPNQPGLVYGAAIPEFFATIRKFATCSLLTVLSKKQPIRFLAKKSLAKFPIFGLVLKAMGFIFIDRKKPRQAFESIMKASDTVEMGRPVVVFPEGRRSRTDEIQPFKNGGFLLARIGKVPILPVGVYGTQNSRRFISPYFFWFKQALMKP